MAQVVAFAETLGPATDAAFPMDFEYALGGIGSLSADLSDRAVVAALDTATGADRLRHSASLVEA